MAVSGDAAIKCSQIVHADKPGQGEHRTSVLSDIGSSRAKKDNFTVQHIRDRRPS